MTKVMKKLACVLMAIMMVAVMMPAMAFADEGASDGITVYFNGKAVGKKVSVEWMQNHSIEPQIFAYAGKQGAEWGYRIAVGPEFEDVLIEALGISSLKDIDDNTTMVWTDEAGETAQKFPLTVKILKSATVCFGLQDDKGNMIYGPFNKLEGANEIKAVSIGKKDVTPVLSLMQSGYYNTYEEATAALKGDAWKNDKDTTNNIKLFVGGNLNADPVKAGGEINMKSDNFNGKFAMDNYSQLRCEGSFVVKAGKVKSLKATNVKGKKLKVTWKAGSNNEKYIVKVYKGSKCVQTKSGLTKKSFTTKKLTKGQKYKVKVWGVSASGNKSAAVTSKAIKIKK
ncbi:MAG: hypothetical protein KBS56_00410 [Clostridiales bacterium]|nr:hypothetical protein [Candidatus Crickella equi]